MLWLLGVIRRVSMLLHQVIAGAGVMSFLGKAW